MTAAELDAGPARQQRPESVFRTLRRGLAESPTLRKGILATVLLGVVATTGRVAVSVAVQIGIDRGLRSAGGPNVGVVTTTVAATAVVLLVAMTATYLMNVRLYTASEVALSEIRTRTFRHIHDLSIARQQEEQRGALVSRITSDVDQISQFLQWGGIYLILSITQFAVATVAMAVYSWQLTLVVWVTLAPLALVITRAQRHLSGAFTRVRAQVGEMSGTVSESVVGADVVRAYGVGPRTEQRLDESIEKTRSAQERALRPSVSTFAATEIAAALALAAVVGIGVVLGTDGRLTVGEIAAFFFLVTLLIQPLQISTEILSEGQNAVAGWRRVLAVADMEREVADPGSSGVDLPPGPIDVRYSNVSFAYPGGTEVLSDVLLSIPARSTVAVVGETGAGKTTFAKLLARLMDPTSGEITLSGVPLARIRFADLRRRVVLVPQDGFLFDATVADNVRLARPDLTDGELATAFAELGLADWLGTLPSGVDTPVGERGATLSVGERQLVALARAYVADPDLLILDEATSAVDPATEVRLQRALDRVSTGRTTVAIAHRLSTAQAADEIVVFDAGRVIQRGTHEQLAGERDSVYARLLHAWLQQTGS